MKQTNQAKQGELKKKITVSTFYRVLFVFQTFGSQNQKLAQNIHVK